MRILKTVFMAFEKLRPFPVASAHCDIPCGIYDPHMAQVAAHTVIRMTGLMNELRKPQGGTEEQRNEYVSKMTRYTLVKEEHAELCKREIRVLWGDYFKPEHVTKHPELHELVWKVMKLGSKARQEISMPAAQELLETVQKIAEIFWKTKGLETTKMKASYPSGGEIVVPKQ